MGDIPRCLPHDITERVLIRFLGGRLVNRTPHLLVGLGPPLAEDMAEAERSLDLGCLVLAQGAQGAWFPARVVQAHSTAVLVALQSDVEQHTEWVPLGCGRYSSQSNTRSAKPLAC